MEFKKVVVLGAGSWGTALAQHLAVNNLPVCLWGRKEEELESVRKNRENKRYLPGVILSEKIIPESSLKEATDNADIIIFAVPSSATRELASQLIKYSAPIVPIVSTAKGLEPETNKRASQIISEIGGDSFGPVSVLSGPTFALEIAKCLPSAIVLASSDDRFDLKKIARLFHRGTMRVYTSNDLIGVELGGVLKNMVSLAAGIGDGLGSGHNARAALLTRGLKEISRLIEHEGGKSGTVSGLSGLGDLILTATGDLSRNRRFGILLGEGHSIDEAQKIINQTIESITSAEAAYSIAKKHNIEAPITEQVAAILRGERTPGEALRHLLTREQKPE
ncbi:MAG TPA: NAD(P)H-dependent glycerol-3-phosphate dehydrogenase [Oligoflexia bacterium]|nr:NAD(P)H-dependent glycerol-3-phosphate dehydrogenase [Oligoflexia bacterium]HMP48126.1 NAD(P)H-dependent glycerol-3-phosphate dehydrogenase [Oligoflexia bacterium]